MLISNSKAICSILTGAALGLAARHSAAATLTVCPAGCTHSTIQATVNVAADYDLILIHPGRYVETVTIQGKSLTLMNSADAGQGSGTVNVVGPGRGPVFVLGSGATTASADYKQVTLYDLNISGGTHPGGTGVGGGIQVRQGTSLLLQASTVSGNSAVAGGGIGIDTPNGPSSQIINSVISGNTARAGGGVVVQMFSAVEISDHSVITHNTAQVGGGGFSESNSHLAINNSILSANLATGACDQPQGNPPTNCDAGLGGGFVVGGAFSMSDSTVTGNQATAQGLAHGGGLYLVLESTPISIFRSVFNQNTVSGNQGGDGGAIFAYAADPAYTLNLNGVYVVDNNNYSHPLPASASGGILNEGTLNLVHTTIADNYPGNCVGGTGCPP